MGGLALAPTGPHGHVPHAPTGGPIPLAVLAKVAGLVDIVVVEVTKFGVHAFASRAREDFFGFFRRVLGIGLSSGARLIAVIFPLNKVLGCGFLVI